MKLLIIFLTLLAILVFPSSVFAADVVFNEISTDQKAEILGERTSKTPLLFISLVLIFLMVCGILAYFQFGEKLFVRFRRGSKDNLE